MRRSVRQIYFACAALTENKDLIFKTIPAFSVNEAIDIFTKDFNIKPLEVQGPFYKKRAQVLENTTKLLFSNQSKSAEYNGWKVNAILLKSPENHAFLIFKKRIDEKNIPKPQGTVVVPIYDLRFTNE